MNTIVLVSPQVDQWRTMANIIEADGRFTVINVHSAQEALKAAEQNTPVAMAIDEALDDMPAIELVMQLLKRNAMINVAMASSRPADIFHEETEGLGLLMQLSPIPSTAEAGQLVDRLHELTGIS